MQSVMRRLSLPRLLYRGIAQHANRAAAAAAGILPSKRCQALQQLPAGQGHEPQAQVLELHFQLEAGESRQRQEQNPD
eukprot:scaffold142612_cov18-Tisochrysis_lutea.AAC.1